MKCITEAVIQETIPVMANAARTLNHLAAAATDEVNFIHVKRFSPNVSFVSRREKVVLGP